MSEILKLDPGALKKAEWIAARDELIENLSDIESVESDSELTAAGKLQTKASKHLKELEKIRKAVKQPALDFGREIDAQAKEMRKELESGIARIKQLNGDYATAKAKAAEAERLRIAEAEAARIEAEAEQAPVTFGGLELTPQSPVESAPAQPLPTGKVSTGANAMVTVWEFEIVNQKLIPAEFLTVDEKKIRAHMNYKTKLGETPEVDGVRFTSRVDVRAR
jgi:hypothetical protein